MTYYVSSGALNPTHSLGALCSCGCNHNKHGLVTLFTCHQLPHYNFLSLVVTEDIDDGKLVMCGVVVVCEVS